MAKPTVLLSPRFRASLKHFDGTELRRIEDALRSLPDCFGRPHSHAGIGLRRMRGDIFECGAGLKLRILFRAHGPVLMVFFVGDHDEVRRLLRNL